MAFTTSDGKIGVGDKTGSNHPRSVDVSYRNRGDHGASTTTTYDNQKYNITQHEYPTGLMTNPEYGGSYAVFYINVQTDSKLIKNGSVTTVTEAVSMMGDRGPVTMRAGGRPEPGAKVDAITAQGTVVAAAAATAGGVLAGVKGAAIASAPVLFGGAVIASQAASATRAVRRIKTAIALNMPNLLSTRYSVNWSDDETLGAQAIQTGFNAAADGMGAMLKALSSENTASNMADIPNSEGGRQTQASIAALALSKMPNSSAISAMFGIASNPMKEQIFRGVEHRSFTYDYQFFPRNSQEAANVQRIIQTFKTHMYPEFKDTGNFIYIYPSEFDIYFYKDGKENLNVHRHTSCVLTDMNVNYTPNGNFSTFADGMPTQINVSLSFRELALLDKDRIADGM